MAAKLEAHCTARQLLPHVKPVELAHAGSFRTPHIVACVPTLCRVTCGGFKYANAPRGPSCDPAPCGVGVQQWLHSTHLSHRTHISSCARPISQVWLRLWWHTGAGATPAGVKLLDDPMKLPAGI